MVVQAGVDRGELLQRFHPPNRSIARSRRRNGRWLFSVRLFSHRPISRRSRLPSWRMAAGYERSPSVTIVSARPCRLRAFSRRPGPRPCRGGFRDVARQDYALVINRPPQAAHTFRHICRRSCRQSPFRRSSDRRSCRTGRRALVVVAQPALARNILLVNDDGLTGNLVAPYQELKEHGHDVVVSVPCRNQSGMGAAVFFTPDMPPFAADCRNGAARAGAAGVGTMTRTGLSPDFHYVDGTPVMATMYGLDVLSQSRWGRDPDIVLSGPTMPRSNRRSSTFRSDSGKRIYIMTTRRITSGDELK